MRMRASGPTERLAPPAAALAAPVAPVGVPEAVQAAVGSPGRYRVDQVGRVSGWTSIAEPGVDQVCRTRLPPPARDAIPAG